MNVPVINSGSSSVKFQLFKMPDEKLLGSGKFEKANDGKGIFNFRFEKREVKRRSGNFNYKTGIHEILKELIPPENCCIKTWN